MYARDSFAGYFRLDIIAITRGPARLFQVRERHRVIADAELTVRADNL
jgi:hypothetical protein